MRERDACCATAVEGGSFTRTIAGQSRAFGGRGRRGRGRTLFACHSYVLHCLHHSLHTGQTREFIVFRARQTLSVPLLFEPGRC